MTNLAAVVAAIVDPATYAHELGLVWDRENIAGNLTDLRYADAIERGSRCYVLVGAPGGFVITPNGDLQGFFTTVPGTGSDLAMQAIAAGARTLDCFDGYLPGFWAGHGFVEYRREPNWTPGEPDVVYMKLACPTIPCPMGSIHVDGDHQ